MLKEHGVKRVIASPGSANSPVVASVQIDPFFDVYSCVDERSAAYLACGMAAESGEPVMITCTGATASRNYVSGLTEAYYRKLPVLAVTSTQPISRVGHHVAQVVDRSEIQNDVANLSVTLPIIKDDDDLWDCEIKVNRALLELKRRGGGPAHINLQTSSNRSYKTKELPKARVIHRFDEPFGLPELPKVKIGVFVGSHGVWSREETEALDRFCEAHDAAVFCDHTSNYRGRYRLLFPLAACQETCEQLPYRPDLLIHIGEVSGDYHTTKLFNREVWRVSKDGEVRDTFRRLRYVFEMSERSFFDYYARTDQANGTSYWQSCQTYLDELRAKAPQVPLSNIWLASQMAHRLPERSVIHFAILNSLRSWNLFELPGSVSSASNVGGFGIDGGISSALGASLVHPEKPYYCVIGDLAFFYDMNAIGNRHVGRNLRILLVNNGKGTEFRQYKHHTSHFGDSADEFIAAAGHFGNKSRDLVKHYAQDLGFEYLSAETKEGFEAVVDRFLVSNVTDRPMILEVFTDSEDESRALGLMMNIDEDVRGKAKQMVKQVLGKDSVKFIKNFVK